MLTIQQFAHQHKNYLVIIADPKDDNIFVSYKDKQVSGKISSADGLHHEVVRRVLAHSSFNSAIDRFLGGIIDVLKCPIEWGSDFYKFIDGALFNISQAFSKYQVDKDDRVNKLMNLIVETKNVELYRANRGKFSKESRAFLEERLNIIQTEPSATK